MRDDAPDRVEQHRLFPTERTVALPWGAAERVLGEEFDSPLGGLGDRGFVRVLPCDAGDLREQRGRDPFGGVAGGDESGDVFEVVALELVVGPHLVDVGLHVVDDVGHLVSLPGPGLVVYLGFGWSWRGSVNSGGRRGGIARSPIAGSRFEDRKSVV